MAADDSGIRRSSRAKIESIVCAKVSTKTNINQHTDERKGSHERTGRFQSDRGNVSQGVQPDRGQIRPRAGYSVDLHESDGDTVFQRGAPNGPARPRSRTRDERRVCSVRGKTVPSPLSCSRLED